MNEYQRPLPHILWQGALNMNQYPIIFDDREVGRAEMEKQGMFFVVRCFCNLKCSRSSRIYIDDGTKKMDLGLCIPIKNGIGLTTRIQVNHIDIDHISFFLTEEHVDEKMFLLKEGIDFEKMDALDACRFKRIGKNAYIIIDQQAVPQDSDQIP